MTKQTVYLETSVIGYLAMRTASVLRIAANQQVTLDWWENRRHGYNLCVSRFVVDECSKGDSVAARERLAYLDGIRRLPVPDEARSLADALLDDVPLPAKAEYDALHISVAAVNGIQYLLTWNCKHIANPSLRPHIERVCRQMGREPPTICTPHELLEIDDVI